MYTGARSLTDNMEEELNRRMMEEREQMMVQLQAMQLQVQQKDAELVQLQEGNTPTDPSTQLKAMNHTWNRLKDYGKTLNIIDGLNREELRQWIEGLDIAAEWSKAPEGQVLSLAMCRATGALRTLIHTTRMGVDATERTWPVVREVITRSFLDQNERQYLRTKLKNLTQQPYEEARRYSQRYLHACQQAHTTTETTTPLIAEILTEEYVAGLRDAELRKLVCREQPKNLEEAMRIVDVETTAASQALQIRAGRSTRVEEPMEIGALEEMRRTLQDGLRSLTQGQVRDERAATAMAEPVAAQVLGQPRVMMDVVSQLREDFTQQQKTMQGEIKGIAKQLGLVLKGMQAAPATGLTTQAMPTFPPCYAPTQFQPPPAATETGQPRARRPLSEVRCFECRLYGHFARECPTKDSKIQAVVEATIAAMSASKNG